MPGEALSLSTGTSSPVTRAVEVLAIDGAGERSLPARGSHGVGVAVAPVIGIPIVGEGSIGTSVVGIGGGISVVGGIGVISVGVIGVSVGVTGVFVGVTGVSVGGIGEFVQVGTGVLVGMSVGVGPGWRVLVGSPRVGNRKITGVLDTVAVKLGLDVTVSVGGSVGVDVAASSAKACMVSAPAVFKFETNESSTSAGCMAMAVATFRSCIAIPETEHSRLIPRMPAKKTHTSPR